MLAWWELVLLSVIQGIAEFLPISSSGHLVIAEALLGIHSDQADLNIALHFGTLLSILIYYRERIIRLLGQDKRIIPRLIVGTVPAALLGLAIKEFASDEILGNALLAGAMLPITGLMMLAAARIKPGDHDYVDLTYKQAFLIGVFQAFALLPGISRSGSTIFAALLLGLRRSSAATFSFLLAIPAILGATVLEVKDVVTGDTGDIAMVQLAIGALVACVVGVVSLHWLVRWLEIGKIHLFAYWVIPFGLIVVVWQLLVRFG